MSRDIQYHLVTDTHFGHEKLVERGARPRYFGEQILNNLHQLSMGIELSQRSLVLIHLGDLCWGDDAHWCTRYRAHVPYTAKSWLVRGNHDKKSDVWYLRQGFDWVGESMMLHRQNLRILLSHKPQPDLGAFDINIHGHFHDSNHHEEEYRDVLTTKHILLAMEHLRYKPISLDVVIGQWLSVYGETANAEKGTCSHVD